MPLKDPNDADFILTCQPDLIDEKFLKTNLSSTILDHGINERHYSRLQIHFFSIFPCTPVQIIN